MDPMEDFHFSGFLADVVMLLLKWVSRVSLPLYSYLIVNEDKTLEAYGLNAGTLR